MNRMRLVLLIVLNALFVTALAAALSMNLWVPSL